MFAEEVLSVGKAGRRYVKRLEEMERLMVVFVGRGEDMGLLLSLLLTLVNIHQPFSSLESLNLVGAEARRRIV